MLRCSACAPPMQALVALKEAVVTSTDVDVDTQQQPSGVLHGVMEPAASYCPSAGGVPSSPSASATKADPRNSAYAQRPGEPNGFWNCSLPLGSGNPLQCKMNCEARLA